MILIFDSFLAFTHSTDILLIHENTVSVLAHKTPNNRHEFYEFYGIATSGRCHFDKLEDLSEPKEHDFYEDVKSEDYIKISYCVYNNDETEVILF